MYVVSKEIFRWRRAKRGKRDISICTKLLALELIVFAPVGALAAPTGGVVTAGAGTISQAGTATNINQATPRLDVNWQTFSTLPAESVNFYQPSAVSVAVNRVIGGVPSMLQGALNANGRVFVLNQAGITFTGTSQVNVGALVASTARDVTIDGDHYSFSGGGYGQVINQGNIHVSDGGFAVLAAPYVENTGVIQANLGQIQLASANNFTVDLRGDGLINFSVSRETIDAIKDAGAKLGVDNSGALQAQSGTIGISAALASQIVHSVVNLNGVVDASALGAGQNGGTVLVSSAGDTNIGGEVHADGGANGNGGTITTWADGTNRFLSGAIMTARGGTEGGDGGLVKVSGHNVLYRGTVDASAPNGKAGTLLLDPWAITIADGAGTDGSATFYEQNIEATSVGGTNVSLSAYHSITMNDLADNVLQGGAGDISMTVTQGGTISFVDKNDTIATTTGKITMTAPDGAEGHGTIDIGHLQTTGDGGAITLTAGSGGIHTATLSTGGLGLGISHPGDITLTTTTGGNITTGNISIIAEGRNSDTASADLNINAGGNVQTGTILVSADANPGYDSSAYAYATANISGRDITISGDLTVSAHAKGAYGDTASADAQASLNAGRNVTVSGNIAVQSKAEMTSGSEANAKAGLEINAGDNITLTGDTLVLAEAQQQGEYGGDAYSDASATLNAGADTTINGNISVQAKTVNDASSAWNADATANLDVFTGHDLILTGNTLVTADATLGAGGTESADAYTYASLEAGHDVKVNGDITVQADAVNNGQGASNARADANLSISADNDLSLTGNTLVTADATLAAGGSYTHAKGSASADLNAGHDATINGNTTVQSTAQNHADGAEGYTDAFSDLHVYATNDLYLAGNTSVTADATQTGVTGYTGYYDSYGYWHWYNNAQAKAYANLSADHDATIASGPVSVGATASNEGHAQANANLDVNAQNDLAVTGDTQATADVTQIGAGGYYDYYWYNYAQANAETDLSAGHNVTVNGNTTVQSAARTQGEEGSGSAGQSYAYSYLNVWADNDLNVTGDMLVTADATRTGAGGYYDYYGYNYAQAYANLNAGHNGTVNGNMTVSSTAQNQGGGESESTGNVYTYAYSYLNVWADNDLSVTGDPLVTADAIQQGVTGGQYYYYNYAQANASAYLGAGQNVTIVADPVTVAANASNQGRANAWSNLCVSAGDGGEGCGGYGYDSYNSYGAAGSLSLTGNTSVTANATQEAGGTNYYYYNGAYAWAQESLYAPDSVTVKGDSTVQANASNQGSGGDGGEGASAFALLTAMAEKRDLTMNGNILVTADASQGADGAGMVNADAYGLLTAGRNLSITGNTINVAATADNQGQYYYDDGGYGNANANANAGLVTLAGIDLAGIDSESAWNVIDGYYYGYYGLQLADLNEAIGGFTFGAGNLKIAADIKVTADATGVQVAGGNDGGSGTEAAAISPMASALAVFGAGNDVQILTDPITVTATTHQTPASTEQPAEASGGTANAVVFAKAGLADGGQAPGNLYITGDILATALTDGGSADLAYAGIGLYAPNGDLTVLYGTMPPTAEATLAKVQAPGPLAVNFSARDEKCPGGDCAEGQDPSFVAEVEIQAGGKVRVEPKPKPSPANNKVGIITALEINRVEPIEPLPPGALPLRIGANGEALWATGVGVTAPTAYAALTPDIETAIAAGADPTTLLTAPAAGGKGLSSGLDAYSIGGTDFCDQVVSGGCLPRAEEQGRKKK